MHYTFLSTEVLDDLITEAGDYIILEESGEVVKGDVIFSRAASADVVLTESISKEVVL